jgi:hypothetical protein
MPIKIDFLANVGKLTSGIEKGEDALESIGDALDDLARNKSGDKVGDKLGDSIKDGARKANRSTEDVEAGFREMAQAAKRESDEAGDAIGRNIKRGTEKAEEGLEEVKREAASTAKESGASFDGSADSIIDAFQEVAANAFAGFGPAGLVAGLAVAGAMGIAVAGGQKVADALNDAKERAGELANELGDVGGDMSQVDLVGRIREWGVAIKDDVQFWEFWQKSAVSNVERVQESAQRLGLDFDKVFRGLSGYDSEAAKDTLVDVNRKIGDLEDKIRSARGQGNIFAGIQDTDGMQLDALRGMRRELEAVPDVMGDAQAADESMAEAVGRNSEVIRDRNDAQREATQSTLDAAGANLDLLDATDRANEAIKANGETHNEATEKGRANQQALIDLASATLATAEANYINGAATEESNAKTQQGRDAFVAAAQAAGYTADEARRLADTYGLVPETVSTEARLEGVKRAEEELARLVRERNAQIRVGADTSAAERAIFNLVNQQRTAKILVREQLVPLGGSSNRMGVP